jgi:hypothetical protein
MIDLQQLLIHSLGDRRPLATFPASGVVLLAL